MIDTGTLKNIIETDFAEIVDEVIIKEINEVRILLIDHSFVDVWFSLKIKNRYSYHWERKFKDKTIYRHDNIPHLKWKNVATFPKHFHNGTEGKVEESYISDDIVDGTYEFIQFIRKSGIVKQSSNLME